MEEKKSPYAIRKLTPTECFRLMGVTEDQTKKMLAAESNSQCYKAAGNSIVVPVLIAIFLQLGLPGVKRWNEMSQTEKETVIYKGTILENKEAENE